MFNIFFLENRAVYERMWEKRGRAGQATDDNTMGRVRIAFWTIKARVTLSHNM
jgi:hypothetical protein